MPADLDRMFAALRADADALSLTEPAAPRRRGERLRRTRVGLSAIATACLVVAVTAGGAWLGRGQERPEPARPPMPPVGHPVDFTPLKQVGPGLTFDAPTRLGQSASVGDRAFVGWQQQDGLLKVAALDLRTGRPAWPARSLGRSDDWNGLIAQPQAVIMIAGHNDGRPLDQTLFVLDPATGQVRWERGLHMDGDELVFFDAAMVIAGSGGQTTALDWRTGAELWSIPAGADPPVRSFGMRLPADLGGPGAPDGYGFALTHSDGRLLQLTRAGNLLVSDVRTGRKLAEPRRVAAPTRADGQTDGVLAYDERLFLASSTETPYRVRMTELTTASKAQVIYTAPVADRTFAFMAPCGGAGRRICLTETGGDPKSVDVVAVDLTT
ncbi:MAG TPA: PQQ-binding-like beta-propeller repeat protein, partial [Micromonosporaceae bacterium]|nr:PQQ-binding-like beta-propeller repeat protein [Micromonosporaceae bacterium]